MLFLSLPVKLHQRKKLPASAAARTRYMGTFIQNQILGMLWLKNLTGKMLCAFGLDIESRIGGSVHFFLYDVIKISILLFVLIFIISYIQSFFPAERSKKIL